MRLGTVMKFIYVLFGVAFVVYLLGVFLSNAMYMSIHLLAVCVPSIASLYLLRVICKFISNIESFQEQDIADMENMKKHSLLDNLRLTCNVCLLFIWIFQAGYAMFIVSEIHSSSFSYLSKIVFYISLVLFLLVLLLSSLMCRHNLYARMHILILEGKRGT